MSQASVSVFARQVSKLPSSVYQQLTVTRTSCGAIIFTTHLVLTKRCLLPYNRGAMEALALKLKEEIDRELAEVKKERSDVRAEREALAEEKASMSQLTVVDANDLIELNAGGEYITTTRGTLTSAEGSMLAAMFSGRWEDRLTLDKDGRVFFDLNPYALRKIIDYLRLRQLTKAATALPAPVVAYDMRTEFNGVVEYLGLEEVFCPRFPVSLQLSNPDSTLLNVIPDGAGGSRLTYTGYDFKFFCTDTPIPVGACWKIGVNIATSGWLYLGIIAQKDAATDTIVSCSCQSSYGWAGSKQVWAGGSTTTSPGFLGICTSTYYFQLLETELLMLQVAPTGAKTTFRLTIPASCPYVIHLNFGSTQTELVLGSATEAVFDNAA